MSQPKQLKRKKKKKEKVDPLVELFNKGKDKGLAAKEITLEEETFRKEIHKKEEETLKKVFKIFARDDKEKFFSAEDVNRVLLSLGVSMSKSEINNMIWVKL